MAFWTGRKSHGTKTTSEFNRYLGLHEGIQQANDALDIFEWIIETKGLARCLNDLAWLLLGHKRLDAAEDTASRARSPSCRGKEGLKARPERRRGQVVDILGNDVEKSERGEMSPLRTTRIKRPKRVPVLTVRFHEIALETFIDGLPHGLNKTLPKSENARLSVVAAAGLLNIE